MGGRDPTRRPVSPPLSPLSYPKVTGYDTQNHFDMTKINKNTTGNERNYNAQLNPVVQALNLKNSFDILSSPTRSDTYGDAGEGLGTQPSLADQGTSRSYGDDTNSGGKVDPEDIAMDGNQDTLTHVGKAGSQGNGVGAVIDLGGDVGDTNGQSDAEEIDGENPLLPGTQSRAPGGATDYLAMIVKLESFDEVLGKVDKRSAALDEKVKGLMCSLEFSQQEISELKKENVELKKKIGSLEVEDRRTQFQVNLAEEKLDKIETLTKKKNLIIDGVPEVEGRKEIVEKTMCALFDQLSVNNEINFEACFRVGPYNKHRARPILVSFVKQSDRDLIYSKRMDLKRTADFQRVWINEDLGPLSKRKRGLIRLISKEAQQQGIDCRTGKYTLHIDNKKYDGDNLEDLPPKLQPTCLKQVQINKTTIAYQSEFAPFSNFFPREIMVGQHKFFCLEQAFQFTKAKTLNKSLAAMRIYLSRDVRFIKQIGHELGTSEIWEARQYDVMYECLKRKFMQHPDLKALLLKTGNLELVEATPDRLWGCGATLSSNVLRRMDWPGKNKHGEILMTLREEFRREMETQS